MLCGNEFGAIFVLIASQKGGARGKLTCSVAHSDPTIELFWHCDNHYLGSTKDLHKLTIDLAIGTHNLFVVASNGRIHQYDYIYNKLVGKRNAPLPALTAAALSY